MREKNMKITVVFIILIGILATYTAITYFHYGEENNNSIDDVPENITLTVNNTTNSTSSANNVKTSTKTINDNDNTGSVKNNVEDNSQDTPSTTQTNKKNSSGSSSSSKPMSITTYYTPHSSIKPNIGYSSNSINSSY